MYVHHMMRIKMQNILDPHSRSSLNRAIAPGFLRTFRKPHCKKFSTSRLNLMVIELYNSDFSKSVHLVQSVYRKLFGLLCLNLKLSLLYLNWLLSGWLDLLRNRFMVRFPILGLALCGSVF